MIDDDDDDDDDDILPFEGKWSDTEGSKIHKTEKYMQLFLTSTWACH